MLPEESPVGASESNGDVEAAIRTISGTARSMGIEVEQAPEGES